MYLLQCLCVVAVFFCAVFARFSFEGRLVTSMKPLEVAVWKLYDVCVDAALEAGVSIRPCLGKGAGSEGFFFSFRTVNHCRLFLRACSHCFFLTYGWMIHITFL